MNKKIIFNLLQYYNIVILIYFTWNGLVFSNSLFILYSLIVIFMNLCVIYKEKINFFYQIKNKCTILLIPILFIISTYSSIFKENSLISSLKLLILTINILLWSCIYNKKEFFSMLSKYFVLSIFFCIIIAFFIPQLGLQYYEGEKLLRGVYNHKNILGRNMVLASIILLNFSYNYSKYWLGKLYKISGYLAIVLVICSKSFTSIILLSLFIILNRFIKVKRKKKWRFNKIIYGAIILANTLICIISTSNIVSILESIKVGSKDLTFSGRIFIWKFSLEYIKQKPFLGYGLNAFWSYINYKKTFFSLYGFSVSHSHNGYINLILDGGIIMFALIMLLIIKIMEFYKNKISDLYSLTIVISLGYILSENLFESCLVNSSTYIFWVVISYYYCLYKEE
ncbi:MAG: exopolysaccharide production protein ExoQ [Clostridium butyricum]|nr:exopolysaccharide production protein ExoQ [Clostridium butyricum]